MNNLVKPGKTVSSRDTVMAHSWSTVTCAPLSMALEQEQTAASLGLVAHLAQPFVLGEEGTGAWEKAPIPCLQLEGVAAGYSRC